MLDKAIQFITTFYQETNKAEQQMLDRIEEIKTEYRLKNTYTQSTEELEYGAKLAWRNSNKCIGRFYWKTLNVFDRRNLLTEEEIFQALLEHLEFATNNGMVRPTISIFAHQRVRIWNEQLIRYAGYEIDGEIIGDPISVEMTKQCMKYGFVGKGGRFDVLPLLIQVDDREPKLFEIPEKYILEVKIEHPEQPALNELDLKWYAVPAISNMAYEVGGISYEAAPFNGWYMGTEIAARNFADEARYNLLPSVAEKLNLDVSNAGTLWKDRALVELNYAVLQSYKKNKVMIVDHHTAAQQFSIFEKQEGRNNRDVTGNWVWLIPPISPATTHIFHKPYNNEKKSPSYNHQKDPFDTD